MRLMSLRASLLWVNLVAITTHAAEPTITLRDAVMRATTEAGAVQLAGARTEQSTDRVDQARAALLPSVTGSASLGQRTFNLKAQGFPLPPTAPDVIGPIDNVDARVRITQTLVDVPAWQRWRAAGLGAAASRADLAARWRKSNPFWFVSLDSAVSSKRIPS